jgi:hypothetical protein
MIQSKEKNWKMEFGKKKRKKRDRPCGSTLKALK